ncbi:hypothetical protein R4315_24535, partial [Rhodococcus oxybenzonivorans]|nr:hypothetical protein [Rhodococcus oxybenzonivorans]
VGAALIQHVVDRARARGQQPCAEFVPTEVNRVMLVTLRFGGFEVASTDPERLLLRHNGIAHGGPNTDHVRIVSAVP